jgi:putative acetyltransferase
MPLETRLEREGDQDAISSVVRLAFGREDEARLVDRLRDGGWSRVSLIAEQDGQVVGHVLFSDLRIVSDAGTTASLALAPMAVLPDFQSSGIGTRLIEDALRLCRQQGHAIVIVLGHQHYYPRFGFSADLAKPLESPYAGDSFMALELVPGALAGVRGRVEYPPPFSEF